MQKSVLLTISGRVQNVGFRYFSKSLAERMGVKGFVKNLANGKVYIEAEADEEIVAIFIESIKSGPKHAHVSEVQIQDSPIQNFTCFERR